MRRAFLAGALLLFCGAIAARGKTDPLVFAFLRVNTEQHLAMLRPMIAPDIGVQLDSGPRELKQGTVLRCVAGERTHDALVEDKIQKVSELLLDCGGQKFIIKTLDFSPRH